MSINRLTKLIILGLGVIGISGQALAAARNVDFSQINIWNSSTNSKAVFKCAVYGVTAPQIIKNDGINKYVMNNHPNIDSSMAIASNPVTGIFFDSHIYMGPKNDHIGNSLNIVTFYPFGGWMANQAYWDAKGGTMRPRPRGKFAFSTMENINNLFKVNADSYGELYGIYSADGTSDSRDWSDIKRKQSVGIDSPWKGAVSFGMGSKPNTVLLYDNQYIGPKGSISQLFEFINSRSQDAVNKATRNFGIRCEVYPNIGSARADSSKVGEFYFEDEIDYKNEHSYITYNKSDQYPGGLHIERVADKSAQNSDGTGDSTREFTYDYGTYEVTYTP